MNKTNKEKNMEHEQKQQQKVRPKQPEYQFEELQQIVNSWIRNRE
jgi:hypothetical protein